ncbi:MAG: hypothetical protein IPJ65_12680 [Archangiaceae bacterium]|nr:hypothetical protein [Archangiaceae bacterium]
MRPLVRHAALISLVSLAACSCDTDFENKIFACASSSECAAGFACIEGTCALDDGGTPLTDAGPPDAGPPDAGPPDAGPADAGPPDAGPPDAGPPDAGPPDAGPPDSGPDPCGPTAPLTTDAGTVPVFCALNRTLTIDANLGDWAGVRFTPLTKDTAELVKGSGTWSTDAAVNNADISGLFALQWDNQYLYVAGMMTDDVRAVHPASQNYYADDCFQIYLDGNHNRTVQYGSDDLDLLIRADNAAQQFILATGMNVTGLDRGMMSATRDTDAGVAGWNIEVAIPWALLGGTSPFNGRILGFDLIIDDDDQPPPLAQVRKHYLIWEQNMTSGSCMEPYCSTVSLGDALLVGAP